MSVLHIHGVSAAIRTCRNLLESLQRKEMPKPPSSPSSHRLIFVPTAVSSSALFVWLPHGQDGECPKLKTYIHYGLEIAACGCRTFLGHSTFPGMSWDTWSGQFLSLGKSPEFAGLQAGPQDF